MITNRLPGAKYGYSDINRVEAKIAELQNSLNADFGFAISLDTKTNWARTDIPQRAQMERYRQNVAALRAVVAAYQTTPQTPDSMRFLTAQEANDIERILQDIEQLLNNTEAAWIYCGESYSGEGWL